jgi:hypothetical protein
MEGLAREAQTFDIPARLFRRSVEGVPSRRMPDPPRSKRLRAVSAAAGRPLRQCGPDERAIQITGERSDFGRRRFACEPAGRSIVAAADA